MRCRVCGSRLGSAAYEASAPGITSLSVVIDLPTRVYVCTNCGHAQSDDLPDAGKFYDKLYRISLDNDHHDQLYAMAGSGPIYRNDHQAELILSLANPPLGARILDYGAAKALTLQKIVERRPDVVPHVFDVSADYVGYWADWMLRENGATYHLPEHWKLRFDLVTAHFVFEHVADPIGTLRTIYQHLKEGGALFLTVPNPIANPGDLIVVDHVSHFTRSSLQRLLGECGFDIDQCREDAFEGAHVVVARKRVRSELFQPQVDTLAASAQLESIAEFWTQTSSRLRAKVIQSLGKPCAIYGAGFYGCYLAAIVGRSLDLRCFVDRNPHMWGPSNLGPAVIPPYQLPNEIEVVYAGLNPLKARAILADVPEWRGRTLEFVYMDDS